MQAAQLHSHLTKYLMAYCKPSTGEHFFLDKFTLPVYTAKNDNFSLIRNKVVMLALGKLSVCTAVTFSLSNNCEMIYMYIISLYKGKKLPIFSALHEQSKLVMEKLLAVQTGK